MTAVPLSQSEIVARLLEIKVARRAFDVEEDELFALLHQKKKRPAPPVPLTFGKNVITWGGSALPIKGKGYKFIKVLYEADKMRLKEATIGRIVWGRDKEPNHPAFKEFTRWLAEKLEKAKFPYQLRHVMSKGNVKRTGKMRREKPIKVFVPPEIIGVRLYAR